MSKSRIPYRETEDYIADSVANIATDFYSKNKLNNFNIVDLGCGEGIILYKIICKLVSSYNNIKIKVNLIDISKDYIEISKKKISSINNSNIKINSICKSIFNIDKSILVFDFLYVFWRKSDLDNYDWNNIKAKVIVSYKHSIDKLNKNLKKIIKSNTQFELYENLYVYSFL